jgi:uncharacterized protein YcbK (DUF882 family)
MNLTKNFTLEEMTKSETALRYDIDNTPNEQEISAMKLLAEKVLQPVRDHFGKGVKVNSGFRNQDVNQKVGGSRNSDHTRGQACDIEIPGVPNAETRRMDQEQPSVQPINLGVLHPRSARFGLGSCFLHPRGQPKPSADSD